MSTMQERQEYIAEWTEKLASRNDSDGRMIWIDFETTGLVAGRDLPLEIAVVATDGHGFITETYESLLLDPAGNYDLAVREANDVVVRMHNDSGLWEEALGGKGQMEAWNYKTAAVELEEFLLRNVGSEPVPMSGSSVAFDRGWFETYFDGLSKEFFTYRNIDVSSLIEIAKLVRPNLLDRLNNEVQPKKFHRGLPDLIDTIRTYRYLLSHLLNVADPLHFRLLDY